MFIKRTKNPAGREYYHLVESYRDKNGKSRHRTLLSLGRVEEDKLEKLAAAISHHKEIFTFLELAKHVSADETFILGPLFVLKRLKKKAASTKFWST